MATIQHMVIYVNTFHKHFDQIRSDMVYSEVENTLKKQTKYMNTSGFESTLTLLLLGVAIALVHMMFQLGISVLTLLSGHSLGLRKSHLRLLHLNYSYIFGAFVTIILVAISLLAIIETLNYSERTLWIIATIISVVVGCTVCLVYYRRGKGTMLWLPRNIAEYLSKRAKKTTFGIEAAALGGMTIVAELPFAIAPLLVLDLLLRNQTSEYKLIGVLSYAFLVVIPLLIVTALIGSGPRLSTVQRWRENNKTFLQYSAGLGLIIIALYLTVFYIVGVAS